MQASFFWLWATKKIFLLVFHMNSNSCKNDILLRNMIYGFRRMIYLLRKHDIISVPSYANGIYHRTIVRYHIEDISPVPAGTDIIEKRQVSVETCRFSWLRKVGFAVRFAYCPLGDEPLAASAGKQFAELFSFGVSLSGSNPFTKKKSRYPIGYLLFLCVLTLIDALYFVC